MSSSYDTWAEASTASPNRNTHWRPIIHTHGSMEDISDPIHTTLMSGSTSISALVRSLGTKLCMKPSSSRWLSVSMDFFKGAAHSLCLCHWKLLYRVFEKIHLPSPPTIWWTWLYLEAWLLQKLRWDSCVFRTRGKTDRKEGKNGGDIHDLRPLECWQPLEAKRINVVISKLLYKL